MQKLKTFQVYIFYSKLKTAFITTADILNPISTLSYDEPHSNLVVTAFKTITTNFQYRSFAGSP